MKVLNVAQVRKKKMKFSATIFSNLNSIAELKKGQLDKSVCIFTQV